MFMRILLAGVLGLHFSCGWAALAAEPQSANPVLSLGKGRGWTLVGRGWIPYGDDGLNRGLLARELGRQAVLLSAREELHLPTCDVWLDELLGEASTRLDLVAAGGDRSLVELLEGTEPVQRLLWKQELELSARRKPFDYARLLAAMEQWSRTHFKEQLRKLVGGNPATTADIRRDVRPASSAEVDRLLGRMEVCSQFAAVRTLHASIRRAGESPERIGQLVRGYANLGLLTELNWHPMHAAFKARACLYAQRWVAREPQSSVARFHRAYAYALAGLHLLALADMPAAGDGKSLPAWVAIVADHCRYNTPGLAAVAADRPDYELAQLLRYICFEQSYLPDSIVRLAGEAQQKLPHCQRIADGLLEMNRKFEMYGSPPPWSSTPAKYGALAALPDLPASVRTIVDRLQSTAAGAPQSVVLRAQLIAALRDSNSSDKTQAVDEGELAWPVLGRVLLEEAFMDCLRAQFALQPDALRAFVDRLLAGHPYRNFFLVNIPRGPAERAPLLAELGRAIDTAALECKEFPLIHLLTDEMGFYDRCLRAALSHQDEVVDDYLRNAGWGRHFDRYAQAVMVISPYSPFARAKFIELHWKQVQGQAKAWEEQSAEQPQVLLGLGKRYALARQFDDAERCLAAAAKLEPGWKTQSALAETYKRRGQIDRWIATLEQLKNDPEHGSEVPILIADYYVTQRRWDAARPYAEAAAESGSSRGMLMAATMYEVLQDWPRAEHWARQVATSDSLQGLTWYFFCRRTGQGNTREAQQLAQKYMQQRETRTGIFGDGGDGNRYDQAPAGAYYLLDYYPDKARQCYQEEFLRNHGLIVGLHSALVADTQQNAAGRDAVLADIEHHSPGEQRKLHPPLVSLARLMAADLARGGRGALDWNELDKLAAAARSADRIRFCYFLGAYLDAHGQPDKAIEYFKQAMINFPINSYERTLAGNALLTHNIFPAAYKTGWQKPAAEGAKER